MWVFVEDDVRVGCRRDGNEFRIRVRVLAVTMAVSVSASSGGPEFSATGSWKDSRWSFPLFDLGNAREHIKRFGDFLNQGAANYRVPGRETIQQGVVTQIVDGAWNSRSAAKDVIDRTGRKDVEPISAGHFQARIDVLRRLFDIRQSLDLAA